MIQMSTNKPSVGFYGYFEKKCFYHFKSYTLNLATSHVHTIRVKSIYAARNICSKWRCGHASEVVNSDQTGLTSDDLLLVKGRVNDANAGIKLTSDACGQVSDVSATKSTSLVNSLY